MKACGHFEKGSNYMMTNQGVAATLAGIIDLSLLAPITIIERAGAKLAAFMTA